MRRNDLGYGGARRNDGWFFDGHGHDEVLLIYFEADTEPERERHHSNAVLDHVVCSLGGETTFGEGLCVQLGQ